MTLGFSQGNKERRVLDGYVGKYVVLFVNHQSSFSGFLKEIRDGYVLLHPHVGSRVEEGRLVQRLIDEQAGIREDSIIAVEPTTRKIVEVYCKQTDAKNSRKSQTK